MLARAWPKAADTYVKYTPIAVNSFSKAVTNSVENVGRCVTEVVKFTVELGGQQVSNIIGDIKIDFPFGDGNH
jgi:hypothetical protein